ncbi:testicular acid phosphatase homolog [Argiope bruennichi]|uniref:testicular acid phosphatase homolog n=1 Tax=Argiope bruennichi TaxID=94029 RepID=UPI0024945B73|nr:testicular acid phosphatase homolog [Argiope bruennichi]
MTGAADCAIRNANNFQEINKVKLKKKCLLLERLFRHGDRAPIALYKNDPNAKVHWPGGLGKLTRAGKKHHYALGKFLRSMYKTYLTSNPKEVIVNSSAVDRCVRGAEVTVAALYEPEGIWKFEDDLIWQPIPIYYLPEDQDKYMVYRSACPRGFQESARLINSEERLELIRKHQKMLEEVSNYTEMDISREMILFLYDTLNIEKTHNLTIPTLIDNYYDEIQEFAEETFKIFFGSDLILRLRIGPFLQKISENMKKKINGDIPDLKIQLYCAQDVNLNAVFAALNFTNMPRAPYCATLLFELHEMADALMAVRLLYLNSTDPLTMGEPHVLILDDCSEYCPLSNFTKKFQRLIPDNWEQECRTSTSDSRMYEWKPSFEARQRVADRNFIEKFPRVPTPSQHQFQENTSSFVDASQTCRTDTQMLESPKTLH